MKHSGKLATAIALLACGSAFAEPQPYNPSWYLTPSVIGFEPDSRFFVDENGEGIGLHLGKPLSQHWDMQIGASFARAKNAGVRYDQHMLGADALYMFSRDRFRPFILIGAGLERDDALGRGINVDKTSPYMNAGIGFQYSFSDRWSTQLDLRRVHGFLEGNGFGRGDSDNDYLKLGISYTFSQPKQVAAVRQEPAAMPAAPAKVVEKARFERQTLSATELFAFDRSDLDSRIPKLDEIAVALGNNPDLDNIVITGYTDRLGSSDYNLALSMRRAEAVKGYLVNKGIDARRLSTQAKGEANPVVQCSDTAKAALIKCLEPNRRVEVERITVERRIN